jgi:hypothetical protein
VVIVAVGFLVDGGEGAEKQVADVGQNGGAAGSEAGDKSFKQALALLMEAVPRRK